MISNMFSKVFLAIALLCAVVSSQELCSLRTVVKTSGPSLLGGRYRIFRRALRFTNIFREAQFNANSFTGTVLAPTNEAMKRLFRQIDARPLLTDKTEKGITVEEFKENPVLLDILRDICLGQVYEGDVLSVSFFDGGAGPVSISAVDDAKVLCQRPSDSTDPLMLGPQIGPNKARLRVINGQGKRNPMPDADAKVCDNFVVHGVNSVQRLCDKLVNSINQAIKAAA